MTVSWAASTMSGGRAVSGYEVKRYDVATLTPQLMLSACTGTVAATTCVESGVPAGSWKYSVTPVFGTTWQGAESPLSSTVVVGPVAVADSYTVNEDAVLTVAAPGVLSNDSGSTSAVLVTGAANGTLTLGGNGAVSYTPGTNFNGSDSFTYKTTNGALDSATVTVTITVTAVNDAPVNAVPITQHTPRNTARTFNSSNNNLVSISDVEAGGATVQVQLVTTNGTTNLPVTTGLTLTAGANNSANMTFTGTIANFNLRLAGMVFTPTTNFTGAASLQVVTSDLGNTGSGGTRTDTDTITINVNAYGIFTNQQDIGTPTAAGTASYSAPTYTVTGRGTDTATADELQFVYRQMTGDGRLTARVVTHGSTNSVSKAGVMFRNTLAADSAHAALYVTGTGGIKYQVRASAGAISERDTDTGLGEPYWLRMTRVGNVFTEERSANGSTGWTPILEGGNADETHTVPMNATIYVGLIVASQNDTTTNTSTFDNVTLTSAPTAFADSYSVNEDATLTVPATGVLANDTDPESNALTAALVANVANGSLTFNSNGSFTYTPTANYSGPDSFTYRVNDGLFNSNTVTVSLTVNPANEVPSFTKGANQTPAQNAAPQSIAGWATAISQGTGESGQLVHFVATNDNTTMFSAQPAVSATGTLTYTLAANATGTANVSVQIRDNGGTANGGVDTSAAQTFTIIVTGGGSPVVTTTVAALSYTENATATAVDPGLTLTDADTPNMSSATVTISTAYQNGQDTLAFTNQNGITGSWDAGTAVLTLSGSATVANYQTALRSVTYVNASDAPVTTIRTVSFRVNDGTSNSNSATRNIAITAVNDAPVNSVPSAQSTATNTAKVFSTANLNALSISDADAGANTVQAQLVSTNGTATLSSTTGLSFTAGANGTANMTFTGTITSINNAFGAGLSFNPTTNFNGTATLQIVTSDLGNTGSGGTLTDTDSVSITVAPTYQNTILGTTGLVNYYRMGESSGSSMTDSEPTSPNNGSYSTTSAPTLGVAGRSATDANTAVYFNGVDQYATFTRQISGDFSIEFWFKAPSDSGVGTELKWSQGAGMVDANTLGTYDDFGVSLLANGTIAAGIGGGDGTGSSDESVTSAAGYDNNAWHHVVFTRDQSSGAYELWVNGTSVDVDTSPNTRALNDVASINIGRLANPANYFKGTIDEVSIYNTVLDQATITAHRNAGL